MAKGTYRLIGAFLVFSLTLEFFQRDITFYFPEAIFSVLWIHWSTGDALITLEADSRQRILVFSFSGLLFTVFPLKCSFLSSLPAKLPDEFYCYQNDIAQAIRLPQCPLTLFITLTRPHTYCSSLKLRHALYISLKAVATPTGTAFHRLHVLESSGSMHPLVSHSGLSKNRREAKKDLMKDYQLGHRQALRNHMVKHWN